MLLYSTQFFAGVVAVVDVFGTEHGRNVNRSALVEAKVIELGGTVKQRMNRTVTHLIFENGHRRYFEHALKLETHIVSLMWLQTCVLVSVIEKRS